MQGCNPSSEEKPDRVVFRIIETSDVHGAIFPYDFINDRPMEGSLARVYRYVSQQRRVSTQEVILLDNGDILQGQPEVYYYNFEDTMHLHICARVMNFMHYKAATVGNHDVEAGHPVYDRLVREFHFPWMAANAVRDEDGKPYFKPYTVIRYKGIKIVVFGMITPAIPKWLPHDIWKGMHFDDMVETARKWVPVIREKEHPDILIGMFHAGYDYTYGGGTAHQYKNENASVLVAEKVPGFDLILIGHDHKALNKKVDAPDHNKVPLLDPSHNALWVSSAKITCTLDPETGKYKKEVKGELVSMKGYKPDPGFLEKFRADSVRVMKYVSRPVADFTRPVSAVDALFGDSPFMGLIHTVQLQLSGADVSFAAPLSLHAVIPKGKVYVRDMFKLYRFENYLYTIRMKGSEIKKYLEYSYGNWLSQMKGPGDTVLRYKVNTTNNRHYLAAPYYGFDSAAGIDYRVDVRKPSGNRITILAMSDGTPFDRNKWYKVAVNSYRGNGGGGHLTRGCGIPYDSLAARIITTTDKDLRYYMMKWMEKKKTVTPRALHNWKIVPEHWVKEAEKREIKYFE
ncbi:MAG: bifunctional metallophosphatase/5'-nucleotidase [Bacteroidales bacterium]|nr:bifunctional metallophosphatase/5'-nucleotidase [Bacteroidales bacterium]